MHNENRKAAPDTPGAYSRWSRADAEAMEAEDDSTLTYVARGITRSDLASDHVSNRSHACTNGCPGYPDLMKREIAVPEQGFMCDACKEPAVWEEGWDVTVALTAQDHTLVGYRQVCNSCMNKHAPMLVVFLTRDSE